MDEVEIDRLFLSIQENPLPSAHLPLPDNQVWNRVQQLAAAKANGRGLTLVLLAAIDGNREVLEVLHKRCGAPVRDCVRLQSAIGDPMHLAASFGHLAVIRYLVGVTDVDFDSLDSYGQTATERAIARGHVHVLRFLLRSGVDFTRLPNDPILLALQSFSPETFDFVVRHCLRDQNETEVRQRINAHYPLQFLMRKLVIQAVDKKPIFNLFFHLVNCDLTDVNAKADDPPNDRSPLELSLELRQVACVRWLLLSGRCDVRLVRLPDRLDKLDERFAPIFHVLFLCGLDFDCERLRLTLRKNLKESFYDLSNSNRANPFFGSIEMGWPHSPGSPSNDSDDTTTESFLADWVQISPSNTPSPSAESRPCTSPTAVSPDRSLASTSQCHHSQPHWMFDFLDQVENEQRSVRSLRDWCRVSAHRSNSIVSILNVRPMPVFARNHFLCLSFLSD